MLTGSELGKAIAAAIQMKKDCGAITSQKEVADHFGIKPPSLVAWIKRGTVSKGKLPELWRYFSDVAGPAHWGMTESEWPAGLTGKAGFAAQQHNIHTKVTEPTTAYEVSPPVHGVTVKSINLDLVFESMRVLEQLEEVPRSMYKDIIQATQNQLAKMLETAGIAISTNKRPIPPDESTNYTTPNTGEVDGFKEYGIDDPYYVPPILDEDIEREHQKNKKKKA